MTKHEQISRVLYMRTFKLKLATLNKFPNGGDGRKFSQLEIDTMGAYLDKDENGIVKISDLNRACFI